MVSATPTPRIIDPVRAAESNTGQILAIFAVFLFISLVFVALRLYSRIVIVRSKGWDDYFIILSEVRIFFHTLLIAPGREQHAHR